MVFRDRFLKQQPESRSYYGGLSVRQVLAVLVHCVYFRDLEHRAERKLAKLLGYQDDDAEMAGSEHWQPMAYKDIGPKVDAKELKELGLAFLRPVAGDLHPNKNAPRLAIILRGTIPLPQFLSDLGSDAKIGLEILPGSKRVMRCQAHILKVVNDFLSKGGSQDQICMAGHSLGAGIALLVGKELVSAHGIHIDTHLFNPPLLTAASIASGEFIPDKFIPEKLKGMAWLVDASHATVRPLMKKLCEEIKATLHHNEHVDSDEASEEKLDTEWEKFKMLLDWIPHFYLNPSDIFCLQYIRYYEKQHEVLTEDNIEKSKQARITRRVLTPFKELFDVDVEKSKQARITRRMLTPFKKLFDVDVNIISNVVPSADVWISRQYESNPLFAHSLKQWHQHQESADIRLEFQPRPVVGEW